MSQSGKPELINLRLLAEELRERYVNVEHEFDDMRALFMQSDAYKEASQHMYITHMSYVPGYDAVFRPINDLIASARDDSERVKRKLDNWICGRVRPKGLIVQVVKGRKDIGIRGSVFWYGDSSWGTRIGIKTDAIGDDGKNVVYWNYTRNCDLFLTKEQMEAF